MTMRKSILIAFYITLSAYMAYAQAETEKLTGTWVTDYGVYSVPDLILRLDRYSKSDVERFREKLEQLRKTSYKGDWKGLYTYDFPDQVGISQLRLNSTAGFAQFYVYSCMPELRYLDYGSVVETADTIELIPDVVNDSPRQPIKKIYVKVTWGKRHYLVEESSLQAFAEKAVGVYVEPDSDSLQDHQKWSNYWVSGDLDARLFGLPKYPAKYRSVEKPPIKATVTSIGKRSIVKDLQVGDSVYSESAIYPVKLGLERQAGVRSGIILYVPRSDDMIVIKEVFDTSATGLLVRGVDDKGHDSCLSGRCPPIAEGLIARTKVGNFWF